MSVNVIELGIEELVEGLAIAQGSMTFEQLVAKFGLARAQQLWAEFAADGIYLNFGGTVGSTTAYAAVDAGTIVTGGAPAAVSSTTETALELAQSSQLTAADTGIATYTQGALKTGAGTAQSASLLSLDVGIVGAAVAPILGVALGANLYENNPQFWTLLSQKLLPFCYPGTTKIPAWLDIVESAVPGTYESKTIIDKRIYDLLYEWFSEEGWGGERGITTDVTILLEQPVPLVSYVQWKIDNVYGSSREFGVYTLELAANTKCAFRITQTGTSSWNSLLYYGSSTSGVAATLTEKLYKKNSPSAPYLTRTTDYTTSAYTIDNKTAYVGSSPATGSGVVYDVITVGEFATRNNEASTSNKEKATGWALVYGTPSGETPEGTESWGGDSPSTSSYDKQIIYIIEDPENPGSFITAPVDGLEVALPEKSTLPAPEVQSTTPENWPEGVPWPTTLDFPWAAPEGYEGEWPETMPWPLPAEKPNWWPDVIPYPGPMPMPAESINPEVNPNPNENEDPTVPAQFVADSLPGLSTDPTEEATPLPEENPSIPPDRPGTVFDDPTGGAPEPSGETPIPVVPTIPVPWTPTASSPDGLITVYHPTDAQLKAFASWLWVTYADPNIDKLWNNPFDGVIGLMELYCTPTDVGVKNIRSGFLDSGVSSQTISRYTKIDCGSITVPEYYGNYLDYSPYSKCHVYLPFIGIVELNVDDIVGHAVNINYKIDEYNGSCIAQITVAKSTVVGEEEIDYSNLMYQFSGNCAVELPLAGGTQSAIRAGMIQAAAYGLSSVIGGVISGVSGNIGGAISQVGYGAANAIGSVVSAKSSVQHSGSFGSSYGALGIKTPYIIVTRPKQIIVPNYNELYGYQSHKMVTIGSCHGYLRVREINVKSSTASDEEKKRIEELLKEGVYID